MWARLNKHHQQGLDIGWEPEKLLKEVLKATVNMGLPGEWEERNQTLKPNIKSVARLKLGTKYISRPNMVGKSMESFQINTLWTSFKHLFGIRDKKKKTLIFLCHKF